MKSHRRRFFRVLFLAGLTASLVGVYLVVGLFPGALLDKAQSRMEQALHKKIACKKILYLPFRGLVFDDLRVSTAEGAPLFSARHLAINVRLVPFLREKKILIDRLWLDEPVYDLILPPDKIPSDPPIKTAISGELDVPVIPSHPKLDLETVAGGMDMLLPENVYLERIEIQNGHLFIRRSKDSAPVEELHAINVRLGFHKPPYLRFDGQVRLGADGYATIDLNGLWDLRKDRYEFNLSTLSKDVPGWLLDYQQKHFLVLEEAQFSLKTHLWSGVDASSILFSSEAHLNEARLRAASSLFRGHMRLKAEGSFDVNQKQFDRYQGTLELAHVHASEISPTIDALGQLTGLVEFKPDLLVVRSLSGQYKSLAFEADGRIESFKELRVSGRIHSRLDIAQLRELLPAEHASKIRDLEIQGQCRATTRLSGSLKKGSQVRADYSVNIENGLIKSAARRLELSGVSGELHADERGLEVRHARFLAGGKAYHLGLFVPQDQKIPGWVQMRSQDFEIKADYFVTDHGLRVRTGHASMPGLDADIHGELLDWSSPRLALAGDIEIRLDALSPELTKSLPLLNELGLSGTLRGPFQLDGPWDRPLDWGFRVDAESPLILARRSIRFENFKLQLRMQDRRFGLPYIRADFYGGTLGSQITFDLTKPVPTFDSRVQLNGVDLSKLGPDLVPANRSLAGILVGRLDLAGTTGLLETYRGDGAVSLTRGRLFQTDRFKGMGRLPLVKVEGLDLVTFHALSAIFQVRDKKIVTDNMTMMSETVDLSLRGNVDFSGALDMLMNVQYSEAVYQGAQDTGGLVPLVVRRAGNLISQYRVRGTLKKPEYIKAGMPAGRLIQTVVN